MKKIKTPLKDLYIFQGKKFSDSRGFLREVFHKKKNKKKFNFFDCLKIKKKYFKRSPSSKRKNTR